jgi:ketosteroid isomerase-like protein
VFGLQGCEYQHSEIAMSELREFGTRYAAAWSSQDPVLLASFYAEDGALTVNGGPPSSGRVAIARTAGEFMGGFPDMVVRMEAMSVSDGRVIFRWHWTGTNTGPGGTGRAVDLRGFEEWTLNESGQIVESLGHFDATEYERQVSGEAGR